AGATVGSLSDMILRSDPDPIRDSPAAVTAEHTLSRTPRLLLSCAGMIAATLVAACVLAAAPARAPLDSLYHDAAERLIGAALASDHAWLRLSQLCDGIGNRLSGSASLDRAAQWAAAAMREDGLVNVRMQDARVPHW